ncbi:MAG: homoserine dehydrogenase [Betaproteobacteria bacterium]
MAMRSAFVRSCHVALVGCGTVGSAVARRLLDAPVPGLQLTHVLDRRPREKASAFPGVPLTWTDSIDVVLTSDADIVVEAIGGVEPAAEWVRAALAAGKSVVTANKQVIARHGPALLRLAEHQGRQLRFEAAVGGAMPIVRALGEGLTAAGVTHITGILNGTCNAVLSRMESRACTLNEALEAARADGLAEADPSADLDGADAQAKLAILCALAFGLRVDPDAIDARSIAAIGPSHHARARRRGAVLRQLAHASYDEEHSRLTAWVAPALVSPDSLFARTTGPANAALVCTRHAGEIGLFGPGAGGEPTAAAVVADLLAIARDPAAVVPAPALRPPALIAGLDPDIDIVEAL